MTTVIATKYPPVMCSDSRLWVAGMISQVKKIFKIKSQLIGIAGDFAYGLQIINGLKKGEKLENLKLHKDTEFSMLILTEKNQIIVVDEAMTPVYVDLPFYAIGSGRESAMGALYAGCDAQEATRIAMKVDANSGGRIQTIRMQPKRRKRIGKEKS